MAIEYFQLPQVLFASPRSSLKEIDDLIRKQSEAYAAESWKLVEPGTPISLGNLAVGRRLRCELTAHADGSGLLVSRSMPGSALGERRDLLDAQHPYAASFDFVGMGALMRQTMYELIRYSE